MLLDGSLVVKNPPCKKTLFPEVEFNPIFWVLDLFKYLWLCVFPSFSGFSESWTFYYGTLASWIKETPPLPLVLLLILFRIVLGVGLFANGGEAFIKVGGDVVRNVFVDL